MYIILYIFLFIYLLLKKYSYNNTILSLLVKRIFKTWNDIDLSGNITVIRPFLQTSFNILKKGIFVSFLIYSSIQ